MIPRIVLLSGPPASGKDTITSALSRSDPRFVLFDKLKVGSGRSTGYRLVDVEHYRRLLARGEILQSHERYGSLYAVDKPRLRELIVSGRIPVIHVGRRQNLAALRSAPRDWPILSVLLWTRREVAEKRLHERGSADVRARLNAYDEELSDLRKPGAAEDFDVVLINNDNAPEAIAEKIVAALGATSPHAHGALSIAEILRS